MNIQSRSITAILSSILPVLILGAVTAQDRIPHLQPTGVESEARSVENPGAGTYYLEMKATVPPGLGTKAIRYSVWLDRNEIVQQMGRGDWNVNYVPYWTVDRGSSGKGIFRYTMPLNVKNNTDVRVFVPKKRRVGI